MKVGTSFAVKELDFGDTLVRLQLWDLAGQPHFSSVRPVFYRGAAGIILVFDTSRRQTFDNIPQWYTEVSQVTGAVPTVLIANKVDLVEQRQTSTEEAMEYAEQLGWGYLETSAKEGQGVTEAFRQIAWSCIS